MHDALHLFEDGNVDLLTINGHDVAVSTALSFPYVNCKETDFEAIKRNECMKQFFLKAVKLILPQFSQPRERGIYYFGQAKADLNRTKDGLRLKIETSSLENLSDMITLKEMIFAGTILPSISYEKRQVTKMKIYLSMLRKKISNFFKKFTKI